MADISSPVSLATITGTFVRAAADTADGGQAPDAIPLVGLAVVFTPQVRLARSPSSSPKLMISLEPIICSTNASGVLLGPDGVTTGVQLVASDDMDLDTYGWTYRVDVSGAGLVPFYFDFIAQGDTTQDLSEIVPITGSVAVDVSSWQSVLDQVTAMYDTFIAQQARVFVQETQPNPIPVYPFVWFDIDPAAGIAEIYIEDGT